jgi:hypothetical protein
LSGIVSAQIDGKASIITAFYNGGINYRIMVGIGESSTIPVSFDQFVNLASVYHAVCVGEVSDHIVPP